MPEAWQVISAIVAGILSVGILWKLFDKMWADINRVDKDKVGRAEYGEYCKRMDDRMAAGEKKFDEIKGTLKEQSDILHEICLKVSRIADRQECDKS